MSGAGPCVSHTSFHLPSHQPCERLLLEHYRRKHGMHTEVKEVAQGDRAYLVGRRIGQEINTGNLAAMAASVST